MTTLHAYFALRQQQSFQRALEGSSRGQSQAHPSPSPGGAKSWSKPSALTASSNAYLDVNARDWLGRTVLHLACAVAEPSSLEYVRLLLAHPAVNVNLADAESHWTALHRSLFHGNIGAAVLLLKRSDIDTSLKDHEGYTAFDLYNSTIPSTKPASWSNREEPHPAELFTWGVNRNAALGHGDSDDKTYADPVAIPPLQNARSPAHNSDRFKSVKVKQIVMSRLHTVVVTDEPRSNLRVCGFGSGGRLGPTQHTQYSLAPFPPGALPQTIVRVALGQDHTLAATAAGEVLSWGLNRFAQLGYVIDAPSGEEQLIQATPKKLYGALKKEVVLGVAACKTASACYTETGEVYTWGTNSGQLGYDKAAQHVQLLPRKVTKITVPVISIAMTDTAMACLTAAQDVICIMNDRHFKINFPMHAFPSEMRVYRPPQAMRDANIAKITSCDDTFAALSSNGEVFTFTVPVSADAHAPSDVRIKPQRVWALRKQFSGVRDVALGADGALIVATQSGHVFVRARAAKAGQAGGAPFRFQRVPGLQRVAAVCANGTGAFGALRVDCAVEGPAVAQEGAGVGMQNVRAFLRAGDDGLGEVDFGDPNLAPDGAVVPGAMEMADEDDLPDLPIQQDVAELQGLLRILSLDRKARDEGQSLYGDFRLAHGADIMIQSASGSRFPAHRVWLAARCPVLRDVLDRKATLEGGGLTVSLRTTGGHPLDSLVFAGCSSLPLLILLAYFYTDDLLSVWDPRVMVALGPHLRALEVKPGQVKLELEALAKLLELPKLALAVQAPGKCSPAPSMQADLERLSADSQKHGMSQIIARGLVSIALCPDVIIQLRDREFLCHATVLRARSALFASFFDDEDWSARRRDEHGVVTVNMRHWDWRVMQFPLRFLLTGCERVEENMIALDFVQTSDHAIEFLFEIIAAANELLLYRLVLICSNIVLSYFDITKACYVLSDATHYQTQALMHCTQGYMAANMETMLEARMLDDLTPVLIKQLTEFVRKQQAEKFPITSSTRLYDRAAQRYGDWLSLQDIPQPIVPSARLSISKGPRLSPPSPSRRNRRTSGTGGSPASPTMRPLALIHPLHRVPSEDEMFLMDEVSAITDPSTSQEASTTANAVWTRRPSAQKVDMKTIMAEAAGTKPTDQKLSSPYRSTIPERAPQRERRKMQWTNPSTSPDETVVDPPRLNPSPWKQNPTPSPVPFPDLALPPTPSAAQPTASIPADRKKRAEVGALAALPTTPPRAPSLPGRGPVFSPARQSTSAQASPSSIRRVSSSGAAWTSPAQPVIKTATPLPVSGLSFVAIQQLQLDQGPATVVDKRSIVEIQEEEQELQTEADFMVWWTAEEERVKQEEAQIPAFARGGVPEVVSGAGSSRQTGAQQVGQGQKRQGNPKPHKDSRVKTSAVGS
ncbi:hypothetical protein FIBSPDRAFT_1024492 [Athelia psychrophila]|uniref:BTB domain-containing protein n=1 Tax=Athelia psychrophila TaxID=1759441 RepID=A0A166IE22_9AGAM|nr:hypothetical protein FIBSPDRAFT_1024492 [Fibularhizoctonia sp. CBS 109695]